LNVVIERLQREPVSAQRIEIVERKGLGHPDHMIDLASEAVSRYLSKHYLTEFGRILHHNIDKGLLVGGAARWRFGGGEVLEPIEIIVAGRATRVVEIEGRRVEIPVDEIAVRAIKEELSRSFRFLDVERHVSIEVKIRPGSEELRKTFEKGEEVPLANDTSFGVAFAPFTEVERAVLSIERYLNSPEYKRKRPFVGEDIKVMCLRRGGSCVFTVAAAFIDRFFRNVNEYLAAKEVVIDDIKDHLAKIGFSYDYSLTLNAADDPKEMNIYLTVTGTSAEAGDDGNTGRGNRVYGLITPNRQMSLEAVAGKNPVSHVGKIYNVLAYVISNRIYEEVGGIREVYTRILSTIGHPINEPQVVNVQVIPGGGYSEAEAEGKIRSIVEEELSPDRLLRLTNEILEGKYPLF